MHSLTLSFGFVHFVYKIFSLGVLLWEVNSEKEAHLHFCDNVICFHKAHQLLHNTLYTISSFPLLEISGLWSSLARLRKLWWEEVVFSSLPPLRESPGVKSRVPNPPPLTDDVDIPVSDGETFLWRSRLTDVLPGQLKTDIRYLYFLSCYQPGIQKYIFARIYTHTLVHNWKRGTSVWWSWLSIDTDTKVRLGWEWHIPNFHVSTQASVKFLLLSIFPPDSRVIENYNSYIRKSKIHKAVNYSALLSFVLAVFLRQLG